MSPIHIIYFWLTFFVSLWCLMRVPTRLPAGEHRGAAIVLSLFGFVLWPLFVAAAVKTWRRGQPR